MLKISLIAIQWIVFAYVSYRIGNKLHIEKSYPWYLIPLWNFWILGKESEMKIKDFFLKLIFSLIIIFIVSLLVWGLFSLQDPSEISIISGADGPTSIFIKNRVIPKFIDILSVLIYLLPTIVMYLIFWESLVKNRNNKSLK